MKLEMVPGGKRFSFHGETARECEMIEQLHAHLAEHFMREGGAQKWDITAIIVELAAKPTIPKRIGAYLEAN